MPILRLKDGSLRDEVRQPMYDTIIIPAAQSPVAQRFFFSNVQGKSKARTNLTQNNLLEAAVSFRVQGLGVDCQNFYYENYKALPVIMENSSMQLKIGEKIYWEGPFTFLSGRISANTALGGGTGAPLTATYQKFGEAAVASVQLQGKHCVDISSLQSFFGVWTIDQADVSVAEIALGTPAADTNIKMIFSLKGLRRRPVQ